MKKIFYLFLLCFTSQAFAQIKFTNPILAGFYPDPSITKVGSDYYLVNSTFSYFPGIPVFHSKDLKNWKQIGNVIERNTQMTFLGDGTSRGLFAPSINYHNGTFYMTCTNIDKGGNFVMTAKNPAGPWSDPVWLREVRGIDPSLFFDQDKAYIVYNSDAPDNKPLYSGHRTIRTYEFDPTTLKVVGTEHLLVNGGVDISKKPVWIEGPHIFKRENWYYICAAEGGTSVNHSQVILRSRSATGPYVPYENNPILTQRDLDPNRANPITSTGHAELVEGPDGKTYAIFLAVRPYEGNFYNTGRETFIAPVKWANGWPVINPDFKEVQYEYQANFKEVKQKGIRPQSGNFSYRTTFDKGLDPSLLFLRKNDSSWYNLDKKNGLTMKLKPETCMEKTNPAFVGKRQQHMFCSASTALHFLPKSENEKAGLMIFQGEFNFYFMCKSIKENKNVIQLFKGDKATSQMALLTELPLLNSSADLQLEIEAKGGLYDFKYREGNGDWLTLKKDVDGKYLSTQAAGGFIGSLFALYATSSGQQSDNKASFKWIDYSGKDKIYNSK
ncbi:MULTISPECIES: glycoside hydrolase family 43 protein [unclassified Pedobacter]|uniref:glycoside hydrolase family 43 protein n=1 Tax=unclassified Pedobacter TaxID=2628915 RepID=UPI0014215FD9|nr:MULTISPECIES: glycoside hydrolase family 43 protein [unclassified Pedobacter]NII81152.1 alpha-N-arabinofuranosidase [Pedobacter sp. SG908]NMN35169.1 alpha-N-arabinofuranosidase [Pedobacter sp. SG918]